MNIQWVKTNTGFAISLIIALIITVIGAKFGRIWLSSFGLLLAASGVLLKIMYSASAKPAKIALAIISLAAALVVFVFIAGLDSLLVLITVYPWIADKIVGQTNMNVYLANAIAVVMAVVVLYGMHITRKNRPAGIAILAVVMISYYVMLFIMAVEPNFDQNGKAVKCYAQIPGGDIEYVNCKYKVHPVYATLVKPVTTAVALPERATKIIPYAEIQLFDPRTGEAMYWFSQDQNGRFELYNRPGFHSQTGQMLQPVSKAAADLIVRNLQEKNINAFALTEKEKKLFNDKVNGDVIATNGVNGLINFIDQHQERLKQE
ncbi:MAG: hypothetical protein WC310_04650 [Patescibacteria group bacterium]|jgi:hypothetical protein